jgi:hypothetical protein
MPMPMQKFMTALALAGGRIERGAKASAALRL